MALIEQALGRARAARTAVLVAALVIFPVQHAWAEHDWAWRNPLPQGGALECVAGGDGQWRALGEGATLLHAQGAAEQWRVEAEHDVPRAHYCTAMIYADGVWLAAMDDWLEDGTLLHSTDGRRWTPVREDTVHGFIYHDAQFIGVGQKRGAGGDRIGFVTSSRDGVNWDADVDLPVPVRDIAAAANAYVAVGRAGAVFVSADARDWAEADSGTEAWLYSVARGADRFVAVGAEGTVIASVDGVSWQAQDSGTNQSLYRVRYSGGRYIAVGAAGVVLESADGLSWSATSLPRGNTLFDVALDGERAVAVGAAGEIYTRNGEQPWTARTLKAGGAEAPHRHLRRIAYGAGGFVAVGSAGSVLHSVDGAGWTAGSTDTGEHLWGVAHGAQVYVAVGSRGAVLRSTDGRAWTTHAAGGDLAAVAYGAPGFVAVGAEGRVEHSADGVDWNPVASGTSARLFDVAYGANGYVAVGDEESVLYSADGDRWETVSAAVDGPLTRVAWGHDHYLIIAPDLGGTAVLRSADGRLWERVAELTPELQELAFDADLGHFMASGYDRRGDFALHLSTDGSQWETHPLAANHIRSLTAAGGTLIGVGDNERIIQAGAFTAPEGGTDTAPPPADAPTADEPPPDAAPPDAPTEDSAPEPNAGLPDLDLDPNDPQVGPLAPDDDTQNPEGGNEPQDEGGQDTGDADPATRVAGGGGCTVGAPGRPDAGLLALVLGAGLYLVAQLRVRGTRRAG